MQVGHKRHFTFDTNKKYEIKEIIKDANLPLEWEWFPLKRQDNKKGECPHCHEVISIKRNYTIDSVEVLENEDGKVIYLGYTKELMYGKPLTMRLPDEEFFPDKSMVDGIKSKSKYLKGGK